MDKSIYEVITEQMRDGFLPAEFSILTYVGSVAGESREGMLQGEVEAVMVRIPNKITHPAAENLWIAMRVKKGIKAYRKFLRENPEAETALAAENTAIKSAMEMIDRYEPVSVADSLMSQLLHIGTKKEDAAEFGRFLVLHAKTLQCVKLGIAMLGAFGEARDFPLLETLGACDEFAFFAVKALHTQNPPEFPRMAVEMALKNRGWGKVAAILELPDNIRDREGTEATRQLTDALLRHGAECELGYYMLAVECAIKGRLKERLLNAENELPVFDAELADGIVHIFRGLLDAENVKDADSFDEVPGISSIIASFYALYEKGVFQKGADVTPVYVALKERDKIKKK